jgi:hypothetical protein
MKRNGAVIIALVLWLLFVASNAFALFKSPYPPKAYPPDQTIVVGVGEDDHGVVSAAEPKWQWSACMFLKDNRCAGEYRYVATHLNFAAFVLKRH